MPGVTWIDEMGSPPAKARPAKRGQKQVGSQPRMATVAVRERMNGDEAMMKARADFVRRIGSKNGVRVEKCKNGVRHDFLIFQ